MGNVAMHDLAPVRSDERKELNISRRVTYKQFIKHKNREFSDTCLVELPWSIRDAVSLYESMDVSFNCLTELPTELPLRLPHLSHLCLSHNQISSLPESIGLLFHLRSLVINDNCLRTLPSSFFHLVKLEKVDVSNNYLRELPDDIGTMESLSRLNVNHNKLKFLPSSLGASVSIKFLLAKSNRLEKPPQYVCDQGSEATLQWLRKNISPMDPLKLLKPKVNIFPRVRGNQLQYSVPNPQSALVEYIQTQTNTTNTPSRIKTPLLPPLESSQHDAFVLADKVLGLVYGAAIGDAIGVATLNMDTDDCSFYYEAESLTYSSIVRDEQRVHWKVGDWTTHFDQLALVLDSVVHWAGVVDELDFAKRLQDWTRTGLKELGDSEGYVQSVTISKVVSDAVYHTDPHAVAQGLIDRVERHRTASFTNGKDSSSETGPKTESQEITSKIEDILWADNGALARSAILGVPHFHSLAEVEENAIRICRASHADPRCIAAAVCLSVIVALILQGKHDVGSASGVEALLEEASLVAQQHLKKETHVTEFKQCMASNSIESIGVSEPDHQSYVLKPLACAVAALRQHTDYRSFITKLLMLGADSAANCCAAGALLGCSYGYSRLPTRWITGLRPRQADWLNKRLNLLLDMMGLP